MLGGGFRSVNCLNNASFSSIFEVKDTFHLRNKDIIYGTAAESKQAIPFNKPAVERGRSMSAPLASASRNGY